MNIIFTLLVCICFQVSFAQKLDISKLERITFGSAGMADSLLKASKFVLSDKQINKNYTNYYYTSFEKKDSAAHLLRSLSLMDIYDGTDTSRLVLYRTYDKDEQEELLKQLLVTGYELSHQNGNSYVYRKADHIITNKISEKKVARARPITAYEFESGR
jgi:hypothetical protein